MAMTRRPCSEARRRPTSWNSSVERGDMCRHTRGSGGCEAAEGEGGKWSTKCTIPRSVETSPRVVFGTRGERGHPLAAAAPPRRSGDRSKARGVASNGRRVEASVVGLVTRGPTGPSGARGATGTRGAENLPGETSIGNTKESGGASSVESEREIAGPRKCAPRSAFSSSAAVPCQNTPFRTILYRSREC